MIDAGSRDIAAGVLEQVRSHGWELKKLFLTHSHADHVAGAAFLREQTGCEVCAPGISAAAVEHSFLIPVTLYGGSTIQAQEDRTQEKLKEKAGAVVRLKKNW